MADAVAALNDTGESSLDLSPFRLGRPALDGHWRMRAPLLASDREARPSADPPGQKEMEA